MEDYRLEHQKNTAASILHQPALLSLYAHKQGLSLAVARYRLLQVISQNPEELIGDAAYPVGGPQPRPPYLEPLRPLRRAAARAAEVHPAPQEHHHRDGHRVGGDPQHGQHPQGPEQHREHHQGLGEQEQEQEQPLELEWLDDEPLAGVGQQQQQQQQQQQGDQPAGLIEEEGGFLVEGRGQPLQQQQQEGQQQQQQRQQPAGGIAHWDHPGSDGESVFSEDEDDEGLQSEEEEIHVARFGAAGFEGQQQQHHHQAGGQGLQEDEAFSDSDDSESDLSHFDVRDNEQGDGAELSGAEEDEEPQFVEQQEQQQEQHLEGQAHPNREVRLYGQRELAALAAAAADAQQQQQQQQAEPQGAFGEAEREGGFPGQQALGVHVGAGGVVAVDQGGRLLVLDWGQAVGQGGHGQVQVQFGQGAGAFAQEGPEGLGDVEFGDGQGEEAGDEELGQQEDDEVLPDA